MLLKFSLSGKCEKNKKWKRDISLSGEMLSPLPLLPPEEEIIKINKREIRYFEKSGRIPLAPMEILLSSKYACLPITLNHFFLEKEFNNYDIDENIIFAYKDSYGLFHILCSLYEYREWYNVSLLPSPRDVEFFFYKIFLPFIMGNPRYFYKYPQVREFLHDSFGIPSEKEDKEIFLHVGEFDKNYFLPSFILNKWKYPQEAPQGKKFGIYEFSHKKSCHFLNIHNYS